MGDSGGTTTRPRHMFRSVATIQLLDDIADIGPSRSGDRSRISGSGQTYHLASSARACAQISWNPAGGHHALGRSGSAIHPAEHSGARPADTGTVLLPGTIRRMSSNELANFRLNAVGMIFNASFDRLANGSAECRTADDILRTPQAFAAARAAPRWVGRASITNRRALWRRAQPSRHRPR